MLEQLVAEDRAVAFELRMKAYDQNQQVDFQIFTNNPLSWKLTVLEKITREIIFSKFDYPKKRCFDIII